MTRVALAFVVLALAPAVASAQFSDGRMVQSFIVSESTHPGVEPGGRCTFDVARLSIGRCHATLTCGDETLFSATERLGYGPCRLQAGYLTFDDHTLNGDDAVVLTHEIDDPDLHLDLHAWGETYEIRAAVSVPFDPAAESDPTDQERAAALQLARALRELRRGAVGTPHEQGGVTHRGDQGSGRASGEVPRVVPAAANASFSCRATRRRHRRPRGLAARTRDGSSRRAGRLR